MENFIAGKKAAGPKPSLLCSNNLRLIFNDLSSGFSQDWRYQTLNSLTGLPCLSQSVKFALFS